MTDRAIQVAVARADLILCAVLRWAVIVALLAAVLVALEIVERQDMIDYDRPGVDVTTEGP